MTAAVEISSRDNPLLVRLRRLARDPAAYRRDGVAWLEGEHLCDAMRRRERRPLQAVLTRSAAAERGMMELAQWAPRVAVVDDALFGGIGSLESPARIGYLIETRTDARALPGVASVVLDRLQDAGNVGSILRSAAAFGVTQVLALKGTAALWSPKVLRAGMGAHFGLRLVESLLPAELPSLELPLVGTSLRSGQLLTQSALPRPCAWIFGHEGQGVDPDLLERCAQVLRIPQPGGEESLNVAAAAAVCLYESMRQAQ